MNWTRVDMEGSTSSYVVVFTKHAKERFAQRFADGSEEDQTEKMLKLFRKSKETSGFLNNTRLLQHFYDKYGYERKYFYSYKNVVLFVCEKNGDRICVVTCMLAPSWAVNPQKFRKKVAC